MKFNGTYLEVYRRSISRGCPTEASPAIRKTIAVFVYGVIPPKIKDLRNETRQFYPHNLKSNEPD